MGVLSVHPRVTARLIFTALLAGVPLACAPHTPDGVVGTGTIEVTEVNVAPTVGGRVERVFVDEGDRVRAGDTLVALTMPTLAGEIDARRAAVASAEATLRELRNGPRAPEVAQAEATLRAAEAEAERTASDLARLVPLAAQHVVSAQQLDAARAAAQNAASRRDAAREALRLLQEGTRPERVRAAQAAVESARGALAEVLGTATDLVLVAPVDGVVLGRHVEPGEALGTGVPAVTLGDLGHPWVRVYLGELAMPAVHLGARATATLDGAPDRVYAGRVVAIADKAEYTPRIALTERERADLVFRVKVALEDTTGTLRAGVPVTVAIARTARDVVPRAGDGAARQPVARQP